MKTNLDNNILEKLPSNFRDDLDKNLCTCNDVPTLEIIKAIVNGAATVEEVKNQTYATMGAGCCAQQVERLIECLCAPESSKRRRRKRKIERKPG